MSGVSRSSRVCRESESRVILQVNLDVTYGAVRTAVLTKSLRTADIPTEGGGRDRDRTGAPAVRRHPRGARRRRKEPPSPSPACAECAVSNVLSNVPSNDPHWAGLTALTEGTAEAWTQRGSCGQRERTESSRAAHRTRMPRGGASRSAKSTIDNGPRNTCSRRLFFS